MTFQADPPKLPKWIFLVGDAALLTTAAFIASHSAHPSNGAPLIAIVVCVALAAVCGVIPFIAEYARAQDEAVDERRRALEGMARTVASSAEQVAITANGLHQIADLAQKNLKQAEQLAHHLQERIAELQSHVADARENDKEEIARLESASDKIAKAAGDSAKLETAAKKALAAAVAEFEAKATTAAMAAAERAGAAIAAAGAALAARMETVASGLAPAAPTPAAAAPAFAAPDPPQVSAETSLAPSGLAAPEGLPVREPPAPRKRSPKKAPLPEPGPSLELLPETPSIPTAAGDEFSETAVSSDGATRILVTAYIGIGNRLFIRGEGPGLAWDKGTPLQFVSIGKWRWETSDAATSVRFKLYKNDELECSAIGEQTVDPGSQREFTATF